MDVKKIVEINKNSLEVLIKKSRASEEGIASNKFSVGGLTIVYNAIQPRFNSKVHKHQQNEILISLKGLVIVSLFNEKREVAEEYFISRDRTQLLQIPPEIYHGGKIIEEDSVVCGIFSGKYNCKFTPW